MKLYQEKVGTLLYAASTRPDIAYEVNRRAQHMQAPTSADGRACDRVFRYLAGTKSLGLLFGRGNNATASGAHISAYADADWGSDPNHRKSITGWVAMLGGALPLAADAVALGRRLSWVPACAAPVC